MSGWIRISGVLLAPAILIGACREPVSSPSANAGPWGPTASVLGSALEDALAGAGSDDTLFVVIQYDEGVTSGGALAQQIMNLGAGARALVELPFIGSLATPSQIDEISALAGVVRISLNRELRYLGPSVGVHALAALLDESVATIRADEARAQFGVSGRGVGVAILDTGIDGLYHFDVQYPSRTIQNAKVIVNQEDVICFKGQPCLGSIYVEGVANTETTVGHGTHVAGIAGGNGFHSDGLYTGVAPEASLVGISTGDILFIFWALAGFDYLLQNRDLYNIKVVNNSWGTSGEFDPDDPVNVATRRVHDRGITVVFAAGNSGPEENTLNPYSVAPWVIGVAASCSATDTFAQETHCEGGMLADFSSRGVPGDPLYHPTVTAPGVHIISARASTGTVMNGLDTTHDLELTSTCGLREEYVTYYTCASGTSMASPHVAGVVALMQERAGGALTPDEVKEILVKSADPMDGYAAFEVGAGMVDAFEAVRRTKEAR